MLGQQINRFTGKVLIVLSLTALLAVISGYTHPPQPDEGAAAHIFQLSIAGASTYDLTFPSHGGLAAAFAKRATIDISCHGFVSCLWSPLLP